MVTPNASRAYIMPRESPLTACWRTTSSPVMPARSWAGRHARRPRTGARAPARGSEYPGLLLRRHADVLDLAIPPLIDRDGPGQDVAIGVEGDRSLDRVHLGCLDGIPQVATGERLIGGGGTADRVGDHEDGVVGGDRVVRGVALHLRLELGYPRLELLGGDQLRRGLGAEPALDRLLARLLRPREIVDAVRARLDHFGHDLVGLGG